MKAGIHPDYHPVLFIDGDHEWASRSTMTSDEKRVIDGVEHQVVRIEISSFTHPFFTGKQRFIDTAGRIDKFRKKYGG